ncbi:MAG: hypothetical protein ABSA21_04850 [Candidatus Limnocylindrales bacterium]|jgi:hypothetical protein
MSPRRSDPPFPLEGESNGHFGRAPGHWSSPLPAGIFLDTSIVVYLETYGEEIWDNTAPDPALPEQQRRQIEALRVLMALADRAGLAFAVSPEVARQTGGRYVADIAAHWQEARLAWGIEERGLAPMTVVATLPSRDQLVLAEAYRSGCEVVLTNDLKWLSARHRRTIAALGMEAHTPETLYEKLRPWLALWL